jgi:hypothetical protein
MVIDNTGIRANDSTAVQEGYTPSNSNLNLLNVAKQGDFGALSNGNSTAGRYLPSDVTVVDENVQSAQQAPTEQPGPAQSAPQANQAPPGEERHGATTVKKDDQGNIKEYANADYTLAKHDDGKWFFHQNGSDKFVEVEADSIKMDDAGKVTYNESGLFGKNDQTLGNGSTGFMSSITGAADHIGDAIVNNPLDTVNTIAFAPLAAMDAIAGTHVIDAIGEIQKGAFNEIKNNPGEILRDVAIGAAIGAVTVATGGGALVALGIGAAALATTELVKNDGDLGAVLNDAKEFGNTLADWGGDLATVAGTGEHTQEELAEAQQGLQQLGAFGAHMAAGTAGGVAGGVGAKVVGLENAIPNAARSLVSRPPGSSGGLPEGANPVSPGPVRSNDLDFHPTGRQSSMRPAHDAGDAPTEPISVSSLRQAEAQGAPEPLENPGAFTLPNGKPVDANTMQLMKSAGLTQDSFVYRVMEPKYLDVKNNRVAGNPDSCASILHPDTPPRIINLPDGGEVRMPLSSNASDAGPGLNVALTSPANVYGDASRVLIGIRLGDMLASNGRVFRDTSSGFQGSYYITFDGSVPFYYV